MSFGYLVSIWGTTLSDYHDQVQCDRHEHDRERPEADWPKEPKEFDDERRQKRNE
jgi:hypothetical protein